MFGVILIRTWVRRFSLRVRVGLGVNSLVLAVPLVWAGFVLMQLVSDYSCYYQGVGWGKSPAYCSKLGMCVAEDDGLWESWIWNGFDLRLVFAYLCSDLFLDVGLGFLRVRVRVILLATRCLAFGTLIG